MSVYFNIPVTRLSRGPSHCSSTLKLHFEKEAENRRAPLFKGPRSRGLNASVWRELVHRGNQPSLPKHRKKQDQCFPSRNHQHNLAFNWKLHRLKLFSLVNKGENVGLVNRDGDDRRKYG